MKMLVTALASVALLAAGAPPALAQSHGGSHGGGHGASGGHWNGGGGHWTGGHGGHWGGGYYRGGRAGYALGGLGLGLVVGSAFNSPGYYGYPGYYDYPGYYEYETVEPAPPPVANAPGRYACGAWRWDPARDQYLWIPC